MRSRAWKSHELKVWPNFFEALLRGKAFELRKDDRGFETGDELVLREYAPGPNEYTGRRLRATVNYRLGAEDLPFGAAALKEGYCVLGLCHMMRDDRPEDVGQ